MIGIFRSKQFLVFVLTGGIAALSNFGSRFLFNEYTSFESAVILAYLVGMITAFVLAKLFVFKQTQHSTLKSFLLFSIVNILAIIQTYLISVGLLYYVFPWSDFNWYPEASAHAIGVLFPVFTSYVGHKYISFKVVK